jgi:prevent-host-death family protein
MQVNIHEAKTRFSMLIEKALAGEEVIVARNGTLVVRVVPIEQKLPHWMWEKEAWPTISTRCRRGCVRILKKRRGGNPAMASRPSE